MIKILALVIMLIGIFVGLKWFPQKYIRINSNVQILCITFLIFLMGVSLGNRNDFFDMIINIGFSSFILAIIPITFSIMFVYVLTKKFMEKKNDIDSNN